MKKYIKYGLFSLLSIAAFSACSNVDEWEPPVSEEELLIYSADFSKDLGMFDAVSVDGDQKWEYSAAYSCMVMTGYVDSNGDGVKENNANEDWLISPEIDLKALTAAKVTFEHAGNYFATIENSTTLWISEDYKDGLPSTGIWTQLTITKDITNSDFTFVTPEISLTKYVGKKVRIAFKYNSTTAKAGTWEVKNFSVKSGEAKVEPVEDNGKGTEVSPFNVKGAISNQSSGKWVTGIIVGYIPAGTQAYFIFGADTCTQATNLLLADSSNIPYHSKALPVQLPSGAVRNGLNLKDHKNLIGKKVKMYGDLASYFGVPGLKTVSYFELEDGTKGGNKPFDPSTAIYYETFATGLGSFSAQNVSGSEVWVYNSTYKCAYMTGFVSNQNRANEDWLISPQIDLTGKVSPALSFDHVVRYAGVPADEATVWVSENYTSGLPSTATWTKLPTAFTNAASWDFYNSGDISLSAYANKKIRIAIKYVSTATKAGTWEMKNFIVK